MRWDGGVLLAALLLVVGGGGGGGTTGTSALSLKDVWRDLQQWITNSLSGSATLPWTEDLEDQSINSDAARFPSLIELATELKLNKCVEKLAEVGTSRIINHEGWFTLFCPTDEAFRREKFYPGEETLTDKMRLHVARGKFNSSDFKNEEKFPSLLSKRAVRINTYTANHRHLVTANGRPVIDMDNRARNGYLHIISEVMSSVYARVGSVISEMESCCPQHSILVQLARETGLYEKIDQADPVTLLAPTNGAFTRLHPGFLDRLRADGNLLKKVLSAHVINGTWYSAGLNPGDKLMNWAGDLVTINKNSDGSLRLGSARASLTDITSGNGVTHVIESLVIPQSARKEINKILRRLNNA